jgi:DNA-binding MarR family transcriptional regulator
MSRPPSSAHFYRAEGYRVDESVGNLMRRVLVALTQATDRRLSRHGLTHAQWAPLFLLRKEQASTVVELARELQMDPGAMTRLLDRLAAKGLCTRTRSTADRRVVNLSLTQEGEAAADKVPVALSEVLNAHLAGFSRDEWQTLKALLRRMLVNAEALRDVDACAPEDDRREERPVAKRLEEHQ